MATYNKYRVTFFFSHFLLTPRKYNACFYICLSPSGCILQDHTSYVVFNGFNIHTYTDMANIFALLLICMYIFAILGYSFFGENCPKHFGSLGTCMLYNGVVICRVIFFDVAYSTVTMCFDLESVIRLCNLSVCTHVSLKHTHNTCTRNGQ